MAERLHAEGRPVRVSDTNATLAPEFGPAWSASAADACHDADVVVTMLPNGQIVRDVLLGDAQVVQGLKSGAIVIDTSSSDAAGTIELGRELADRGIRLIDAPVSGGVGMAREGRLTLMVGCSDDELFAQAEPVLATLGARILRVGDLGAGHAAKAINNAIAACIFAVTSEGLVLGERFGLEPATLLDVINSSTGRSGVSEGLFPSQVLSGKYGLGFALALMAKDVGLAEALRARLDLDLPIISATSIEMSAALSTLGRGADFTAFHEFTERRNGASR
jgi:3-hydroxyisobutyrate dehydrogenase